MNQKTGNELSDTALQKADYQPQFGIFRELMSNRVREILLVSSFYDAFVLEEDGGLSERIFSEYIGLNLSYIPRIHRVSSAEEALRAIEKEHFDLIITMTRISDMNLLEFGRIVKKFNPELPLVVLTYEWISIPTLIKLRTTGCVDKIFYWTGDTRMLLAIIKYVEDSLNVDNDISHGVRVILVIEDSPRFYSLFLPIIYTELMTQTRILISEGVNHLHRMLRMRARPKILMAETYEQGLELYNKYKNNLLGVISDIRFPRQGEIDKEAGFKFAGMVKEEIPDLPFLLQSSNLYNRELSHQKGLHFIYKNSENLLLDLRNFILSNFGFGDFIFRDKSGREVGRAANIQEFERMFQYIPTESLVYHASRNHISIWLRARTEFECAEKLRPKRVQDFQDVEALRAFILGEIQKLIRGNQAGVISDFGQVRFDAQNAFIKLGGGSLGGKARGLAFLNTLLAKMQLGRKFPGVEIRTPNTFVLCSDVFDEFIRENRLQEFAIAESDNNRIARRFLKAELPERIINDLLTLLEKVTYPIAVRSSSILEDSQSLPFAGLYSTYMLPNSHADIRFRLRQLCQTVRLVYASVFYKSPKEYVKNTNFRIEEEKMAVIIQQIAGQVHSQRIYPTLSGVAQSYNFYPISHMQPNDGVAELALGLGAIIAEGGKTYRFSPKYPQIPPPFGSAVDFLDRTQSQFYALDLSRAGIRVRPDEKFSLANLPLQEAENDGVLFFVAGTYSAADNAIRDTISIPGPRVVTFANLLKYNLFPLPQILEEVLKIGRDAFGSHVEIEFAVNLSRDKSQSPEFYLLQIRPMVAGRESMEISMEDIHAEDVICRSNHAMGSGVFNEIHDLVYVDPDLFDPAKTRHIAAEIGDINHILAEENRKYILIGFGRWGTSDPWLGIPVEWHQMASAQVIIEANRPNFNIEPSLGSHFFHNLTSLGLGYFHIPRTTDKEFINWEWVKQQTVHRLSRHVRHIRMEQPFQVKINPHGAEGVILKPREK